ncbi:hypothetical protein BUALT_Bualt12G0119900 [Buddleja alternifolia]|uniref:Leucine-rich repeat-containing N-terminal plant-type domain-containing protein n=1 Tax=Buddleja alternifolia TaxID=168488 RepID=A0AAV6WXU7_9LAMI|nr:hypothetical protein BUALT_Bualt12G0119900 [Buddleja alternifolia]
MFTNLFILVLLISFPDLPSSIKHDTETDHQAPIAFKAEINDPLNSLISWNSSIHFCQWNGITCARRHQRVIGLNLANQNLTGLILPHVENLSFLRYSPPELGSLYRLKVFAISRNNITGPVPSNFGNLSSLTRLYGGSNDLTGEIPGALGSLTRLELFAFGENRLTGLIHSTIFNLSNVLVFDLTANQIQSTLPPDIASTLPNLEFFSVGINLFTGSIPISFSNARKSRYLHVGYNRLSGEVPSFSKLNKLTVLALLGNLFDDLSFISSLSNATYLASLGMDDNNFQG